jgi:hypothetical protein
MSKVKKLVAQKYVQSLNWQRQEAKYIFIFIIIYSRWIIFLRVALEGLKYVTNAWNVFRHDLYWIIYGEIMYLLLKW